jgi:uncharacterized protein (DUF58 family)
MRLLIVVLIGALFYFLQHLLFRKNWYKGLDVSLDLEKHTVREGDQNSLIEVVRNDKFLPLPVVLLKFSITRTFLFPKETNSAVTDQYYRKEYFSLRPYQSVTRKYHFTASKRGEYNVSSVDVIAKDYFLALSTFASLKKFTSVLVLPGRIKDSEVPQDVIHLTGDIISRVKALPDPFEFRAIREYQPYDPVHHINWKATAKSDTLMVNTFHTTHKRNVVLLLNMEIGIVRKGDVIAEAAIKIASYLGDYFIQRQIPVALYTNGTDATSGECIEVEAGCDDGHIRTIDVALAKIAVKESYASFVKLLEEKVTEPESEYLIISNYRKEDLVGKYEELKRAGYRLCFIVPEYDYASVKPLEENGRDVVKWGIDYEG